MAAKKSLQDAIAIVDPVINEILTRDYRTELDKRITVLDLSYEALKVNVYRSTSAHIEAYNYAYNTLVTVLNEKATRQYSSIESIPSGYFDKPNAPFLYINGGDNNRFIVSRTFGAARDFVTKIISRDPRLLKTAFGQTTLYADVLNKKGIPSGDTKKTTRTKVDLGHIASANNDNLISPLEMKISDIMQLGTTRANPHIVAAAERALSELYAVQADAAYSFKNTSPEAITATRSTLGELYVVVTLHREKLNRAFSEKEAAIFNKLRATLALKLSKMDVFTVSGSNTIIEDIAQSLTSILSSGKTKKPAKHTTRITKTKSKVVKPKVGINSNTVTVKKKPSKVTTSFSLASLQILLDAKLAEQIKQNMGSGSAHNILNLRSGRFAESAKVERLSESRAGMVTAFYSYMKNPYATFSDGGKQQYPRSRDPKLLIAKSIRELAATQAYMNLRSVNV